MSELAPLPADAVPIVPMRTVAVFPGIGESKKSFSTVKLTVVPGESPSGLYKRSKSVQLRKMELRMVMSIPGHTIRHSAWLAGSEIV